MSRRRSRTRERSSGSREQPRRSALSHPRKPPPGLARYAIVGVVAGLLVALFWATRQDWDQMHAQNRAFAEASFVLAVATLSIGPLARLWPAAAPLIVWRREVGNWTMFTALGHVWVVLSGWVQWDLTRLFFSFNLFKRDWALDQGFALGNLLGLAALAYGFVLLATSNDASVRLLGSSGWKFLQQSVYVLYWLIVMHTAYFLFFHFVTFHRPAPPPNWFRLPFLTLTTLLLALQAAAFLATVRRRKSPQAPAVTELLTTMLTS